MGQEKIDQIRCGDLVLDRHCYTVKVKEERIDLTPKEFDTLCLLARHPEWIFRKEDIYETVYGKEVPVDIDNIIFCLIHSLRKKLELDYKHPIYIKTIRGVGYKLVMGE